MFLKVDVYAGIFRILVLPRYLKIFGSTFQMKTSCFTEFCRPWKVATLAIGIALLVLGSFYYMSPDWDIPISFIMAALAYLTAPWSLRVILERKWKLFPAMLFATWFTVDGCYAIYWHFRDPLALEMMREVNFPASLSLYGMCGLLWYHNGSLVELLARVRSEMHRLIWGK